LPAVRRQRNSEDPLAESGTLGALLCADRNKTRPSEEEWIRLIGMVAAGDQLAVRKLYERAHRLVFALIMRITHSRENAEELTLEVFHELWRRAPQYDPAAGTVVGWIMNLARSKAIVRFNWWTFWPHPAIELREPAATVTGTATEPEWEQAAPGLHYQVLALDRERARVSMLVRLDPGIAYPPHRHAGVEELHLLDGELWIENRLLRAGDYNCAEPGTADQRVWSETGCTCVLVTSLRDVIAVPAQ
jgi:anti-sigma factor ChrR (cupin superfamily)